MFTRLLIHAIDTLARLSVFTVPSSNSSYTALLPHSLPPRTSIPHTLFIITLDWTRPWTFVEELELWLQWIDTWAKGDGARELEIVREENRDRCKLALNHLVYNFLNIISQYKPTYSTMQNLPASRYPRHRRQCLELFYHSVRERSHIIQLAFLSSSSALKPTLSMKAMMW